MRLTKTAPWNSALRNPYRTRYAEHNGRYFIVEAQHLKDFWMVNEIDKDGRYITPGEGAIALCRNLPAVRAVIEAYVEGKKTREEIAYLGSYAPSAGTGKNHPRNVAHRQAVRDGSYRRVDVAVRRAEAKPLSDFLKTLVQPGHVLAWDPPGLSGTDRWTCTNDGCEAALCVHGSSRWGSATETPCSAQATS